MSDPTIAGKKPRSEFQLRVISAVFMAVFTALVTWIGGDTFLLFAAVLSIFVMLEYRGIVKSAMPTIAGFFAFAFLFLLIAAYPATGASASLGIMAIGAVSLGIYELISRRRMYAAFGVVYAGLPFISLVSLRGNDLAGMHLIFLLYACVWGADSFAYLVGRRVGGPKLAPVLSPNKTWSGFIGSLVGAVLIALAVELFFGEDAGFFFYAVIITLAVVSQIGDLVESWLKRRFNKKDSGHIIPGHGGILDRVDGLIFAAVGMYLAAQLASLGNAQVEPGSTPSQNLLEAMLPTLLGG